MKSEYCGVLAGLIAMLVTRLTLLVTPMPLLLSAEAPTAAGRPPASRSTATTDGVTGPVPEVLNVHGRVLNSHGQPVPGAKVYFWDKTGEPSSRPPAVPPVRATTGSDGRFKCTIERSEIAWDRSRGWFRGPVLAAFAEGYGPGWTNDLMVGEPAGALIQLVEDGPPISGRLIDLEGRPVPDVQISVVQIDATTENDLSPCLDEIPTNADAARNSLFQHLTKSLPRDLSALIPATKTASDGRFQLAGAGRERIVSLLVQGPRIETRTLQVMTRVGRAQVVRMPGPRLVMGSPNAFVIHASQFDFVTAPTRAIEGNVRDATTALPIVGVAIRPGPKSYFDNSSHYPLMFWTAGTGVRTTTDSKGHYRLTGLPVRPSIELSTEPTANTPYLPSTRTLATAPGADPVRLDFKLQRGVLVRGKIAEGTTKKPVAAVVEYRPALDNPNLISQRDLPLFEPVMTGADGSFGLVALPGAGIVAATAVEDRFLTADRVADQASDAARLEPNFPGLDLSEKCHAFRPVAPAKTALQYECDLALTPGPEPVVHILDDDGKPLIGAAVSGVTDDVLAREGWSQSRGQSVFRVTGLNSHRIRKLVIHHEGKKLAGSLAVRDSEPGPLVARLRPWGTVQGRLIDDADRPRPGVALTYHESISGINRSGPLFPRDVTTDAGGHFTFEGLLTQQPYAIKLVAKRGDAKQHRIGPPHFVDAGEVKMLGDVQEVNP